MPSSSAPAFHTRLLAPAREPYRKPSPGLDPELPGSQFSGRELLLFVPPSPASIINGAWLADGALGVLGVGMDEHPSALGVQVVIGPDDDAEDIAEATFQLRRELLD